MATPVGTSPQASDAALASAQAAIVAGGPPYSPVSAGLGAPPSIIPDIPISACFLLLFLFLAVSNISLFKRNKKMGHKFVFNGAMFGFCKVRIVSTVLRIAWSCYPKLTSLAIAANIFVYAGAIILYLVNFFFMQRIVRARHPGLGWSKPFSLFVPALIFVAAGSVVAVIVAVLQSFYTLDVNIQRIDHDIQLYVITAFTVLAFMPILVLGLMSLLPRKTYIDKFGAGRFRTKIILLVTSSALLTLGAGFRAGGDWLPAVSILAPRPWYFSTACFYIFTFGVEACSLILYLIARVDKRFYIPDGASGPGSYSADTINDKNGAAGNGITDWPESLYSLYPADPNARKSGYARSFGAQSNNTANTFSTYNTYGTENTLAPYGYEHSKSLKSDNYAHRNSLTPSNSSFLTVDPKTGRYSLDRMPAGGNSTASLATTLRAPESMYTRGVSSRAATMRQEHGGLAPIPVHDARMNGAMEMEGSRTF